MSTTPRIGVMVVDDHPVVRRGIRFSLSAFDDIELLATASSGREALRLCRAVQPDVVLMDLKMPEVDGVTATRAIRERCPQVQVVALTSFWTGELVQEALQAGAIGYILKDIDLDELAQAIRRAHAGVPTIAPAAAEALAEMAAGSPGVGRNLTEREREVLALLAQGLCNNEVAARLTISLSTARYHVSNVLAKLGAANRAEAAALGVKHKLV